MNKIIKFKNNKSIKLIVNPVQKGITFSKTPFKKINIFFVEIQSYGSKSDFQAFQITNRTRKGLSTSLMRLLNKIKPSYESKSDFFKNIKTLEKIEHNKFKKTI